LVIGTNKVAASYTLSCKADHKSFGNKLSYRVQYQSAADRYKFINTVIILLILRETLFSGVTVTGYLTFANNHDRTALDYDRALLPKGSQTDTFEITVGSFVTVKDFSR